MKTERFQSGKEEIKKLYIKYRDHFSPAKQVVMDAIISSNSWEEVYQKVGNKIEQLTQITQELSSVAYIGDDINDLFCMQKVKEQGGVIGCPKDAVSDVREIADYISSRDGGDGAVRDFIEWLVK